jgi:hypothetical protein
MANRVDCIRDAPLDLRAEAATGLEGRAFDSVDDETFREPLEGARQLNRLREAQVMRRGSREIPRHLLHCGIEAVDSAGDRARGDGIDEPDRFRAVPGVDERCRLPFPFEQLDGVREPTAESARNGKPHRIVAAVGVPEPDYPQRRSTSSFRKWVAHEMQGS